MILCHSWMRGLLNNSSLFYFWKRLMKGNAFNVRGRSGVLGKSAWTSGVLCFNIEFQQILGRKLCYQISLLLFRKANVVIYISLFCSSPFRAKRWALKYLCRIIKDTGKGAAGAWLAEVAHREFTMGVYCLQNDTQNI